MREFRSIHFSARTSSPKRDRASTLFGLGASSCRRKQSESKRGSPARSDLLLQRIDLQNCGTTVFLILTSSIFALKNDINWFSINTCPMLHRTHADERTVISFYASHITKRREAHVLCERIHLSEVRDAFSTSMLQVLCKEKSQVPLVNPSDRPLETIDRRLSQTESRDYPTCGSWRFYCTSTKHWGAIAWNTTRSVFSNKNCLIRRDPSQRLWEKIVENDSSCCLFCCVDAIFSFSLWDEQECATASEMPFSPQLSRSSDAAEKTNVTELKDVFLPSLASRRPQSRNSLTRESVRSPHLQRRWWVTVSYRKKTH